VPLQPRKWLEEQEEEDKKVQGTLTFKLNFRETDEYDFTGPIRNLGGWI
jgi:hypothetical protein